MELTVVSPSSTHTRVTGMKKNVHKVNGEVVSKLLSLGDILYRETVNNVIGTRLNPNNRNLSCGGTSGGGEGAFQALRGSLVGLGTVIGGLVRILAALNWI
ncbi:hypothetical protein P280DRAFT_483104 [Massarina eburnea CBS 473.64]|uniref:Amidase domain-containing protein n=1 Tax=Massarina eburnea CBS 473.64 TaxID=1395130 RepID=A0A6A6RNV2_9PLEO|nr:hypothetical protein P280DRAFT_483104 [Massarina eburnea CBS 473.64]